MPRPRPAGRDRGLRAVGLGATVPRPFAFSWGMGKHKKHKKDKKERKDTRRKSEGRKSAEKKGRGRKGRSRSRRSDGASWPGPMSSDRGPGVPDEMNNVRAALRPGRACSSSRGFPGTARACTQGAEGDAEGAPGPQRGAGAPTGGPGRGPGRRSYEHWGSGCGRGGRAACAHGAARGGPSAQNDAVRRKLSAFLRALDVNEVRAARLRAQGR